MAISRRRRKQAVEWVRGDEQERIEAEREHGLAPKGGDEGALAQFPGE